MESFVVYKETSGTVEPSTVRGYRCEVGWIGKYLGAERFCDLTIPMVSKWVADMSADG